MDDPGVSINIAPNAIRPEPQDLLLLEQQEWRQSSLSRAGLVRYLSRRLYGDGSIDPASGLVDCGMDGDNLVIGLYVYPLRPGLQFRLGATAGALGPRRYEEIEESETVHFGLEREAGLRHPASRLLEARWLAGPWTSGGVRVPAPALRISGRNLLASMPLYGSVAVRIMVGRWVYRLALDWESEARPAIQGGWSEFAVAWPPPGRPVALALTLPNGASDMAESGTGCGSGGSFSGRVGGSGEDWPPKETGGKTKTIKCRYCDLECDEDD